MLSLALTSGEAIIVIVAVAVPLAAISFAGAGSVYNEIGKGDFAMDRTPFEDPGGIRGEEIRVDEIRQLLEAKAYRQRARGEVPINVDEEIETLLSQKPVPGSDPELVAEVRDLVAARNSRRLRQGKEPLDVEEEVRRQLSDLESLGQ